MDVDGDHPFEALLATFRTAEPRGLQGRAFERLMEWWLLNDPEYKVRFKSVSKPRKDIGVDLIAWPWDGDKPTAVQCKQWVNAIPKSEIDSFLSAAATDEFADSLLIHTGTGFSANAAATIASQRSRCTVVDQDRLLRSDVNWPTSVQALGTGGTLPPRVPREHQTEALAQIRFELRPGRTRTWVNMACGTGKTLVATLAADEFAPGLAVVFLPTTTALHDAARAWRRDSRAAFADLRICSQDESGDRDLEDLSQPHENVTTSPETIAKFLARAGRRVVFCTIASVDRLVEAVAMTAVTIDLVVVDDAHNIASARGSTGSRAILDDDRLPAERRLFLTATPRVWDTDALRLATDRGAPLISMSNSSTGAFGVCAYRLPHRDAVSRKIVPPFEVHIVQITTDEIDQIVRSRRLVAAQGHSAAVIATICSYDASSPSTTGSRNRHSSPVHSLPPRPS
jgi:predicted helicase